MHFTIYCNEVWQVLEMKDFAKVQQLDTRIHFEHELVPILSKPDSVILGKEGACF